MHSAPAEEHPHQHRARPRKSQCSQSGVALRPGQNVFTALMQDLQFSGAARPFCRIQRTLDPTGFILPGAAGFHRAFRQRAMGQSHPLHDLCRAAGGRAGHECRHRRRHTDKHGSDVRFLRDRAGQCEPSVDIDQARASNASQPFDHHAKIEGGPLSHMPRSLNHPGQNDGLAHSHLRAERPGLGRPIRASHDPPDPESGPASSCARPITGTPAIAVPGTPAFRRKVLGLG